MTKARFSKLFWSCSPLFIALWLLVGRNGNEPGRNEPLFCNMPATLDRVVAEQPAGIFKNPDTLLEHELFLLSDSAQQPLLFYSEIMTPVCIDGICKPVHIELYWSLTGNYVGFGLFDQEPLTKFDHDAFTEADYQKMNALLNDKNSILSRQQLSDLFDENAAPAKKIEYQGVELDAVSGATRKEIKESVVEGALYSCFTLWHLVYGPVQQTIEAYVQSIYTPELATELLYSGNADYQFYALKQMDDTAMSRELSRIAAIFIAAKPLVRTYILKKLPKEVFSREVLSHTLYEVFPAVDVSSKTMLLTMLEYAHPSAAGQLSSQVELMSRNQLKTYLGFLAADRSRLTKTIREKLQGIVAAQTYTYGYMIEEFLQQ